MTADNIFNQISLRIIQEQELIIGPIAWDEAKKVPGLVINAERKEISLNQNSPETINKLVAQFTRLFGQASSEVCKEAVQDLLVELPQDQVPDSLK